MNPVCRGRVVAHFGKAWAIEDENGRLFLGYPSHHCGLPCVGDWIEWEPTDAQHGRILSTLPRKTLLTRPGRSSQLRPVAANVDQVLVVIAPVPEYDLLLVDQYLVVAENRAIGACLIVNKADLLSPEDCQRLLTGELAPYRDLYPVLFLSAKTGAGMDALRAALKGKVSMFAGQSGVGKSSLLKSLVQDQTIQIGELSARRVGRHTTTSARLYHLPEGGDLIDTPGVSVFGLAGITPRELAFGYREFRRFSPLCRFNDCHHQDEPDCAVRQATTQGKISLSRYKRYLKLLQKLPELA